MNKIRSVPQTNDFVKHCVNFSLLESLKTQYRDFDNHTLKKPRWMFLHFQKLFYDKRLFVYCLFTQVLHTLGNTILKNKKVSVFQIPSKCVFHMLLKYFLEITNANT